MSEASKEICERSRRNWASHIWCKECATRRRSGAGQCSVDQSADRFHLWAETYDRKLTDIFSVESEIAKGIAESLQAKLTGREEQALAVKPTNNLEAYDAYLRGLALTHVAPTRSISYEEPSVFLRERCGLTPILHSLGATFSWHASLTSAATSAPLDEIRLKERWRTRRNSSRTRPKPCSPWFIINIACCVITACQNHVRTRRQNVARQQ